MSNPDAFGGLVDYIVDYAKTHPEIDHLHVWLSDGWNNRCECDGCRVKRPSDWYVDLLNELDERLEADGLPTRIVFLAYADLLWAPERSRLRNEDRFIIMFAPLTRTWRTTLLGGDPDVLKGFDDEEADDYEPSGAGVQGGTADPTRAAGDSWPGRTVRPHNTSWSTSPICTTCWTIACGRSGWRRTPRIMTKRRNTPRKLRVVAS